MSCPAVPCVSTLPHKRDGFRKTVIEHKMCSHFFCDFCVKYNFSKKIWALYDPKCVAVRLLCTVPLLLSNCIETSIFQTLFRKILTKTYTIMTAHPVGSELFRAVRQTDGRNEVNSRFFQFCEKLQLDVIFKCFYSTYFIKTGTFSESTNYYNNLCCNCAELDI
jgi:hypothetical protein